jgi:DNA-directed RNA polymerase specialized sigma24 family protein
MNMGSLPVPPDQHHLPRVERQHPFRWLNKVEREQVRADADTLLRSIERLITKMIHDLAPVGVSRVDRADIAQDVHLKIWSYCLPRYDAWRTPKTKPSTFLHTCVYWSVRDLLRRHRRRKRPGPIEGLSLPARDETPDREVEALAGSLLLAPARLGKHAHAILSKPLDLAESDLASSLGISSNGLARYRYDARQKAIEILHAA